MSSIRRIVKILYGLLMLLGAAILLLYPEEGAVIVILILDMMLLIYGFRMLIYYFSMARFMVGGIMTLYKSIIVIDFGLFMFYLYQIPYRLVMLYLVGVMALNGVTSLLGAVEMMRLENHSWKFRIVYGAINLILVVTSLFMLGSVRMVTFVFSLGLINAAFYQIASALKKSAIIYIG